MEGKELDRIEAAALKAQEVAPGDWFTWDDLYVKVAAKGAGNVCNCGRRTWPGCNEVGEHIQTSDPQTVLKLIALVRRGLR